MLGCRFPLGLCDITLVASAPTSDHLRASNHNAYMMILCDVENQHDYSHCEGMRSKAERHSDDAGKAVRDIRRATTMTTHGCSR